MPYHGHKVWEWLGWESRSAAPGRVLLVFKLSLGAAEDVQSQTPLQGITNDPVEGLG